MMQRMSRAQRILVMYLLMKSQEPRVIKKIIRNYGSGIGKHGNDMHTSSFSTVTDHGALSGLTDDDHTQYFLADGSREVSGDILPDTDAVYDLGSLTKGFDQGYIEALNSDSLFPYPGGAQIDIYGTLAVTSTKIAVDVIDEKTSSGNVTVNNSLIVNNAGGVQVDTIDEKTGATGVTTDGVLHKDGGATFAGDVDLAGNGLLTTDLRLEQESNEAFQIRNRADTDYRDLTLRYQSVALVYGRANSLLLGSRYGLVAAHRTRLRSSDGATYVYHLDATNGVCDLTNIGDITMLDTKKLGTSLANDDYFTIEAVDNDTSALVEVAKVLGASEPELGISRAGDVAHLDGKFPILDKASGNGIKVDTASPTFGWRDLLGEIRTRGVGATDPNDAVYNGNIRAYQFAVNDECWVNFHIPHDYVKGTDLHLHFHWSHIGTLVTGGNVTWGADITYAKGHNQAAFPASVNTTVVGNASTTQYQHIITEVQISTSGGAAGQIDTDNLEPDGVIMVRGYLSANNITVSGGGVPDPFLHFKDIHYQSTNIATKDKVPDFYA